MNEVYTKFRLAVTCPCLLQAVVYNVHGGHTFTFFFGFISVFLVAFSTAWFSLLFMTSLVGIFLHMYTRLTLEYEIIFLLKILPC